MAFIRLENKDGHYKFYEMRAYGFVNAKDPRQNRFFVSIKFGIINCNGRTIHKEFESRFDAIMFMDNKLKEKKHRGYEIIESEEINFAPSYVNKESIKHIQGIMVRDHE